MHIPVLQKEVIHFLNPQANENFIDATFGQGGHSLPILMKNGPGGRVLAIELDPVLYQELRQKTDGLLRLILINDSYTNLKQIIARHNFQPVNGILLDLGMSNWHLKESGRGFGFQKDEPLDMRYNPNQGFPAKDIVNRWPRERIEKILKEYGQERFCRRISQEIAKQRQRQPIETTGQLREIISEATPRWYQRAKINPATKTFQALRITVNNELDNIKKGLADGLDVLEPKGRIAVISFHSLEDKIVKNFFRENKRNNKLRILTKKPVTPSKGETSQNSSSRSAKLRAAIKI